MLLVHLQKVRKIIILPELLGLKPNRVIIRLVLIKNILARKVSYIRFQSLFLKDIDKLVNIKYQIEI